MIINFVNLKTGEIRQVKYIGRNEYEAFFLALRRKNIQEIFKETDSFKENVILNDNLAIEFIE